MNERWRIRLFGGLRAERSERVVTRFPTQKAAVLLAYLAYYQERAHPRELLIELLWPESDLEGARHRLSVLLSSLRKQLEGPDLPGDALFVADRFSVQLSPEWATTDVGRLEQTEENRSRAGKLNHQEGSQMPMPTHA